MQLSARSNDILLCVTKETYYECLKQSTTLPLRLQEDSIGDSLYDVMIVSTINVSYAIVVCKSEALYQKIPKNIWSLILDVYVESNDVPKDAVAKSNDIPKDVVAKSNVADINIADRTPQSLYIKSVDMLQSTIDNLYTRLSNHYTQIVESLLEDVEMLFIESNIPESHSIDHIKRVLYHTNKGIESYNQQYYPINLRQQFCIRAAAIEHDADDHKLFPVRESVDSSNVRASRPYQNAITLLDKVDPTISLEDVESIVEMIDLVPASKNRNNIPPCAVKHPWKLIPRLSDIVDAGGVIGVIRCYKYTLETNRPLYNDKTKRTSCDVNVWDIATPERFALYTGKSNTMIDHYYDKLLQLFLYKTDNKYFLDIQPTLIQPFLDIIDLFSKEELTREYFDTLV